MTIAPKDDLLILPQDQTAQTTPEANKDPLSDFSPPSGWGVSAQAAKIDIPEYPEPDNQNQNTKKDSGLVRFVKIFLIAVALILLGVFLGVIASNFLSSPNPTTNTSTTVSPQTEISGLTETHMATEASSVNPTVEPDYTKKIEYRNIGSGPYSFDLLLSNDWKIASKSTEPKNLNIDIKNQDLFAQISYIAKQSTPKSSLCLLSEEIAPKNIPYIKYQKMDELKVGELSWLLVKSLTATQSASYLVCEQNKNNQYTNLTSVGFINIGLTTGEEISTDNKNSILKIFKGLEIIKPATSSAVKK